MQVEIFKDPSYAFMGFRRSRSLIARGVIDVILYFWLAGLDYRELFLLYMSLPQMYLILIMCMPSYMNNMVNRGNSLQVWGQFNLLYMHPKTSLAHFEWLLLVAGLCSRVC